MKYFYNHVEIKHSQAEKIMMLKRKYLEGKKLAALEPLDLEPRGDDFASQGTGTSFSSSLKKVNTSYVSKEQRDQSALNFKLQE